MGEWITLRIITRGLERIAGTIELQFAHLPGDVNQDGAVNIRDATAFGEEFRGQRRLELIDLNRSGTVTIADATEFGRLWYGTDDAGRAWNGARLSERLGE